MSDLRRTQTRIFDVSASCHSIRVTKPSYENSYRNADSRRSVLSRNKALLPYSDLAGEKVTSGRLSHPEVCFRSLAHNYKVRPHDHTVSELVRGWKRGQLGRSGSGGTHAMTGCVQHLLGFNPVIIIRTRYIAGTRESCHVFRSYAKKNASGSSDHLTEQTFP